ncbi:hypothetical protein SLA2020_329590 [Shorea laevis]
MANEQTCHLHNMEHSERRIISSEEANAGLSASNKPLDVTLTENEIAKLKSLEVADPVPSRLNKPLIQKVPQNLRLCFGEDCKRYFEPTSVAIGPLHHQKEIDKDSRMGRGEQCKLKLAAMFIKDGKGKKEDFYKNVKKEINNLKNCYDFEVEKWTNEELAWMFLVDGCALLHFIVLNVNYDWERFSVDNGLASIEKMDFFLLENQLPYHLLEILIDSFAKASPEDVARNKTKDLLGKYVTEFINRSFLRLTAQQEHHMSVLRLTAQQEHQIQIDHSQLHPPHHTLDLLQRGLKFINRGISKRTAQQEHPIQNDHSQPHHLLDLLRKGLIGEKVERRRGINEDGFWKTLIGDESRHSPLIRNVRELKVKGIHFKASERGSAITNIDFKKGWCMATLTLAPIFLHSTTVQLLLNLIAHELCPGFEENWEITSHLSLLDSLIDNGEDAKELKDAGVLHNGLGSDDAVAELLNKISGILVPNLKVDPDLRRTIHEYCDKSHLRRQVARAVAKLTQTYFRSPWSFLVFLGALAGLIMTGMQTYYSFHGNN